MSAESGKEQKSVQKEDDIDSEEYTLRKRLPRKWSKRKIDVYISHKTNFIAQLKRCRKLLESGEEEIYVHGLGVAIDRAINIALQLKLQGMGSLEVSVNTNTVELIDDLEPENEDLEPETQVRNTSSIHIRVFKIALKGTRADGATVGGTETKNRIDNASETALKKPRSKKRKADKTT